MVTTVSNGDNKQADLWLRTKHVRFQTCAALQVRVWLWLGDGRPRFDLALLGP